MNYDYTSNIIIIKCMISAIFSTHFYITVLKTLTLLSVYIFHETFTFHNYADNEILIFCPM